MIIYDWKLVISAGCFSIIPASELVPGDIVEVGGMFALHVNKQRLCGLTF